MNTQRLNLDLTKLTGGQQIAIAQGDFAGMTIEATIYDNGTKLAETGLTAHFVMELPGKKHYVREAATYANGVVTYIVNEPRVASVCGYTDNAYFELQKGTTIVTTERFSVIVKPSAYTDKTPGETYDSRIEQAIQDLEDAIASIDVSIEADVAEWLDQHPEATTTVQDGSITYAKLHSSTKQRLNNKLHRLVTAPVVTASDAYAAPPVALVVDGKSVQDGTPTPDAPVAIESVESVGLGAAGKNLAAGVVAGLYDGNTGRPFATSDYVRTEKIAVLPSTGYVVSLTKGATGSHVYTYEWAADGSFVRRVDRGGSTTTTPVIAIATGAETRFVAVACGGASANRETPDTISQLQLEQGSAAAPYQPYVGSTTAIPLQGHALRSLPDGTHDELRVDADGNVTLVQRVGVTTIDGSHNVSSFTNAETMGGNCTRATLQPALFPDMAGEALSADNSMSDHAVAGSTSASAAPPAGRYSKPASGNGYLTLASTLTSLSDATAWLAENPVTIQYPLATPVEIPLGTVSLPSMPAPDLTAWASCTPATDIELDYERDVTIALAAAESVAANSLAPADGPTATASHAAGSLLTLGGQLVKATRAIVAGEQIAIGTNVAVTTVAAELAALA